MANDLVERVRETPVQQNQKGREYFYFCTNCYGSKITNFRLEEKDANCPECGYKYRLETH